MVEKRGQIFAYWEYEGNAAAEFEDWKRDKIKDNIIERVMKLILRYLGYYNYLVDYEKLFAFHEEIEEIGERFFVSMDIPNGGPHLPRKILRTYVL